MDYDRIVIFGAYGTVGRAVVRNLIATGVHPDKITLIGRTEKCDRGLTTSYSLVINCSTADQEALKEIIYSVNSACHFYHISSTSAELETEYGQWCKAREKTVLEARKSAKIERMGVIVDTNYPCGGRLYQFIGYWSFLNKKSLFLVFDIGQGVTLINSLSFFPSQPAFKKPFKLIKVNFIKETILIRKFPYRIANRVLNMFRIGILG